MIPLLDNFDHVVGCDFEYSQPDGETPSPVCMVAYDLQTGERWRLGADELHRSESAPFPVDERTLFVAYYSSAEINCFRTLGWPLPVRILDLFVEFRCITSGLPVPCGSGLLGALAYHELDSINVSEKSEMRKLAMRGGPYSENEKVALLDYCETDVIALDKLLRAMLPKIDLPRALLRGRYMSAASAMETAGIPVDVETLQRLRENWESIKSNLVVEVDADYSVYVPTNRRHINPDSPFGQMILAEAEAWEIDPYELLDAVDYVWKAHRE